MAPNDGIAFIRDSEEADIHATNGMKMTKLGKPLICHICGSNHYVNRCPKREDIVPEKKSDKIKDTPKKEGAPTKASVNVSIGEYWGGDDTNCGGPVFCQVTAETMTNKNPKMEYQHTLIQSGGRIIPTWVLLDNQSTVDVFSNRRLLKNIRSSDI